MIDKGASAAIARYRSQESETESRKMANVCTKVLEDEVPHFVSVYKSFLAIS